MKVAYIRTSTVEQSTERQREALEQYGIERWFEEQISGRTNNRPKLQEMLDFVREGDEVYIHDFSRISRNCAGLLEIVDTLEKKGVSLHSNKEALNTSTSTGKLMLTMIAALNQWQIDVQREAQLEGIAIAKAQGKYKGRKPVEIEEKTFQDALEKYKNREIKSKTELAKVLGVSRATLYKLLNECDNI